MTHKPDTAAQEAAVAFLVKAFGGGHRSDLVNTRTGQVAAAYNLDGDTLDVSALIAAIDEARAKAEAETEEEPARLWLVGAGLTYAVAFTPEEGGTPYVRAGTPTDDELVDAALLGEFYDYEPHMHPEGEAVFLAEMRKDYPEHVDSAERIASRIRKVLT